MEVQRSTMVNHPLPIAEFYAVANASYSRQLEQEPVPLPCLQPIARGCASPWRALQGSDLPTAKLRLCAQGSPGRRVFDQLGYVYGGEKKTGRGTFECLSGSCCPSLAIPTNPVFGPHPPPRQEIRRNPR